MTNLARTVLAWLLRHLLALVLILVILIVGRYAVPPAVAWLKAQTAAARAIPAQQSAYSAALDRYDSWARERRLEAREQADALARAPERALRERRTQIAHEIARRREVRLSGGQRVLAAARGDADQLFSHYRSGAEIALLERERRAIDALLGARLVRGRESDLQGRRAAAVRQLRTSYARWRSAQARIETLNRRPLAGPRNFVCRTARPEIGCDNYRALVAVRAERDAAAADNRSARQTIQAIDRALSALRAVHAGAESVSDIFAAERRSIAEQLDSAERRTRANWVLWLREPIVETLPTALLVLAGVIFGPLLVKAFLYFAVAPFAARRPPIRLVAGEAGEVSLVGGASAPSKRVCLEPGHELLVVPSAVQSTPHEAAKATQWLLSWRMPMSSLASGMVALIRIRPQSPDFVQVAASGNPVAELALIAIAGDSAMVLRPRALRGLVRPTGEPIRISRHWRLTHLSAWLTLQFRYLVFHGPCTLIVEGTRGVRLEKAGAGRGINQAATIGFSAGLAYAVRRSEAFGAYLIGRQELFNDSFRSASGWYLYEEMPREGERSGLWGRGIRGLGDAVLKVFGL